MATVALLPRLAASVSSDGASSTHGGHHVAKKLTKTGLPSRLRSETVLPVRSGSWNSGTSVRNAAESGSGRRAAQAPSATDFTVDAAPSISSETARAVTAVATVSYTHLTLP